MRDVAILPRELAELMDTQQKLENRKLQLRKTIESLRTLCESEGVSVTPSQEAAGLLESKLAGEIQTIFISIHPSWMTPHRIKSELEKLGRDLSRYSNPQSAIQMVLKRMAESEDTREEVMADGKRAYRHVTPIERMVSGYLGIGADTYYIEPGENGLYRSRPKTTATLSDLAAVLQQVPEGGSYPLLKSPGREKK